MPRSFAIVQDLGILERLCGIDFHQGDVFRRLRFLEGIILEDQDTNASAVLSTDTKNPMREQLRQMEHELELESTGLTIYDRCAQIQSKYEPMSKDQEDFLFERLSEWVGFLHQNICMVRSCLNDFEKELKLDGTGTVIARICKVEAKAGPELCAKPNSNLLLRCKVLSTSILGINLVPPNQQPRALEITSTNVPKDLGMEYPIVDASSEGLRELMEQYIAGHAGSSKRMTWLKQQERLVGHALA